jgi:ribulose-bisphosphate carboxylase large chain
MIKGCDDTLLKDYVPESAEDGIHFDQNWSRCPAPCLSHPVASTPARWASCSTNLGEDVVLQFGGGTIGHPGGIAAGAEANRIATEAMIKGSQRGS